MFYFGDDERDVDSVAEEVEEEETDELDEDEELAEEDDGAEDDDAAEESEDSEDNPDDGDGASDDGSAKAKETFELKYRHEKKTLSRDEVIQYAQKGMEFDRIKEEHTALSEEVPALREFKTAHEAQIAELEAYMQETGAKSVDDVLDELRVGARVAKGESQELAKERVRSQRLERQLNSKNSQADAQTKQNRKAQEDIEAFQKEYPNVKVDEKLLKELGDDLKATGNLTRAYERKQRRTLEAEVEKLKKQLKTDRNNADAKRRSTGSQRSAGGSGGKRDALIDALLSDD